MIKTIKLVAAVAGFAIISVSVSAQMQDPQQLARTETNHIKQTVTGVTSGQESQIYDTELDYTKKVQAIFKAADLTNKAAIQSKIEPLREARDAKMKTILTADQDKEYELSKPEYTGGVK